MRRAYPLESIKYISTVKNAKSRVTTFSGQYNSKLFRVEAKTDFNFEVLLIAKFRSFSLDGFHVFAGLTKNQRLVDCVIDSVKVSILSSDTWNENFILNLDVEKGSGLFFEATASKELLQPYKLTGGESYVLEVEIKRASQSYFKKAYFNHLGCFDSLLMLKNKIDYLELTKLDE
jgi:hypothetical protein